MNIFSKFKKKSITIPGSDHHATNDGLVSFAQYYHTKVKNRYVFGAIGEPWTKSLLKQEASLFPFYYTKDVIHRYQHDIPFDSNIICFDCSGFLKAYYFHFLDNKEKKAMDYNTHKMIEQAETKGAMETLPEIPGICLYMKVGHVGIYLGDGQVLECTENPKFGNGIVNTTLSDREWDMWFYCPGISYDD